MFNFFLERLSLFKEKTCRIETHVKELFENPPEFVGPFLNFESCQDGTWKGNVLCLYHTVDGHGRVPQLHFERKNAKVDDETVLGKHHNFVFVRWNISVSQTNEKMRIDYTVQHNKEWTNCFFVPSETETWKIAFYSCNGLSHVTGYG